MTESASLPSDLAELVSADNDRTDQARQKRASEQMRTCRDESLVPILKQVLAEKRTPDEFRTLCLLLGSLTRNTGNAEAVALVRWLFERPKIQVWQHDMILMAAAASGCKELAPLVRPYLTMQKGQYAAWADEYVNVTKDDGAVEALLSWLDTPGIHRSLAVLTLGKLGVPRSAPALLAFIQKPPPSKKKEELESRYYAFQTVIRLASPEIADDIAALRHNPFCKNLRHAVLVGLCRAGVPEQTELVAEMSLELYEKAFFVAWEDVRVCSAVLEYLERFGRTDVPKVRELLERMASYRWSWAPEDKARLERLRAAASKSAS